VTISDRHFAYRTAQNRAKARVANALKRGLLARGECECADEFCSGKIHGHHEDYARPLRVRWLCAFHHRVAHKAIGPCSYCRARWMPQVEDGVLCCPKCGTARSVVAA
jgi:hypothetical protein